MAEMALGYGSEYQLLRFLGHHRNYLNTRIQELLGTEEDIKWCDYPSDYERKSLDGEFKGIECFRNEANYEELINKWNDFWPVSNNAQNWDGILKIGNHWYFVEAKAHKSETRSSCSATSYESKEIIKNTFDKCRLFYHGTKDGSYLISSKCHSYQLANRLAFMQFCKTNNIEASLLYISFINGFEPKLRKDDSVKTENEWNEIWDEEFENLGIAKESVKNLWFNLCIDCTEKFDSLFI